MLSNCQVLRHLTDRMPDAICRICASNAYPDLKADVSFWNTRFGTFISISAQGLPVDSEPCKNSVFALHIHNGICAGNEQDPFADADGHNNPGNCPHPEHAGDLPPLFSDQNGCAWGAVLNSKLSLPEVIGKAMIIHAGPDDFHTQPSGNSGKMIACGEIQRRCRRR